MTITNITDRELELERLLKQSEHTATIAYMSGFYDGKKKREWVDLTHKELADILCDDRLQLRPELMLLQLQAKLKEKNAQSKQ